MHRNLWWGVVFAAISLLAILALKQAGGLDLVEWMSLDVRMRAFNSDKSAPRNIAVILVDEASLEYMNAEAGRWPWPRSVHADLLDFLALGHPRAVVFDILFTENQKECAADDKKSAPHDQRLIDATAQSALTYHAVQFRHEDQDPSTNDADQNPLPIKFVERFSLHVTPRDPPHSDVSNNAYQLPFDGVWQGARGVGVVGADPDRDGRFRRMRLMHRYGDAVYPSLALAPTLAVLQPRSILITRAGMELDGRHVPLDQHGNLLVNLYANYRAYSYSGIIASLRKLRAGDVNEMLVRPEEFADSIVFVGADAVGVHDLKATALSSTTAGVYLHASTAGNLLTDDFLVPIDDHIAFGIAAVLALLAALGALLPRLLAFKLGALLVTVCGYIIANFWLYRSGRVLDVTAPVACILFSWFTTFSYAFFAEGKDKRRVRNALAQYVSSSVLAEVVDKYQDYLHAEVGRKETISVMFTDIRGFTSLSETVPAEQVVEILNIYFSAMTELIFTHQGTVDKFIGDAIMAFWGAPLRIANHAPLAVHTAIRMLQTLPAVNQKLAAIGQRPLEIGVGINTGSVILGNIGSDKKLEYTAIGDNVNLASRLEGLTKKYQCALLITEYTYLAARHEFPCRIVDRVRVQGRSEPLSIYAPLFPSAPEAQNAAWTDQANALCAATQIAFDLYLQRQWSTALAHYAALPQDKISELYRQRCQHFLSNEPPEDWDGVITMREK